MVAVCVCLCVWVTCPIITKDLAFPLVYISKVKNGRVVREGGRRGEDFTREKGEEGGRRRRERGEEREREERVKENL